MHIYMCVLSKILSSVNNIGRQLQYITLKKRMQSQVCCSLYKVITKSIYDVVEGK